MEKNNLISLTREEYTELLRAKLSFEFLQKYLQTNQYATLSDVKIAVEITLGVSGKEEQ